MLAAGSSATSAWPWIGAPMVVPTVYGVDGDRIYLHGSVASRSLVQAPDGVVCVTVTHVDGLASRARCSSTGSTIAAR